MRICKYSFPLRVPLVNRKKIFIMEIWLIIPLESLYFDEQCRFAGFDCYYCLLLLLKYLWLWSSDWKWGISVLMRKTQNRFFEEEKSLQAILFGMCKGVNSLQVISLISVMLRINSVLHFLVKENFFIECFCWGFYYRKWQLASSRKGSNILLMLIMERYSIINYYSLLLRILYGLCWIMLYFYLKKFIEWNSGEGLRESMIIFDFIASMNLG